MAVRGSFLSLGGKKMATFYNQASLSIGEIKFVARQVISIEALYTTPATALRVATPEEILCAVAIRRTVDRNSLRLLNIWLQMR